MSELEKIFNNLHVTENGDTTYKYTGNDLLDILFKAEYYSNNLDEVSIGSSDIEQLFSMFMRDPRYGMGYRDLGRELMKQSGVNPMAVSTAGRFDDLLYIDKDVKGEFIKRLVDEAKAGNKLAKKWLPSIKGKNKSLAIAIAKEYGLDDNYCKAYRELKKTDVVETLLNEHVIVTSKMHSDGEEQKEARSVVYTRRHEIDFSKVPSLALLKHYSTFSNAPELSHSFSRFMEKVKSGEEKINFNVATHYDLYRNKDKVDVDVLFKELPEVSLNCIPILDTSSSMMDHYDSYGKATAIAHALAHGSTFEKGKVVSFSSRPQLLDIFSGEINDSTWVDFGDLESEYGKQLARMYTGDVSHTDFGATMEVLSKLGKFPEYLVVLSDMEFDWGSAQRKDEAMKIIHSHSPKTKIVWWNFCSDNNAVPETDSYGNIFFSGYKPEMLQQLSEDFDAVAYLNELLSNYSKNIAEELVKQIA